MKQITYKIAIVGVIFIFGISFLWLKKVNLKYNPLISIVITSYNYERYIGETLDSVLKQTYKNYEVVIVDDGSKDNSVELIKRYVNKHKNFYLYTHPDNKNKGLIESLKLGISKAKGEYVAFLESVDYWHKDNLLEKIKLINKYKNVNFISNGVEPFGEDEESVKKRMKYTNRISNLLFKENNYIHPIQIIDFNVVPTFSCIMIKKEILNNLNYDSIIPEYVDFWLYRQILLNNNLFHVRSNLTFWRVHDSYNNDKKAEQLRPLYDKFIRENNKIIFGEYNPTKFIVK